MLSESLLSDITDAVFSSLPEQAYSTEKTFTWLKRDPQRLIFQTAFTRAYATFDRTYPQWTKTFFDNSFLKDCAASFLARCLKRDQSFTPAELVTAWAKYMGLPTEQYLVELISPATDFLGTLNDEFQTYTEFHSLFNSFTLETITAFTTQISIALEALLMELTKKLNQSPKYNISSDRTQGQTIGDSNVIFQTFVSSSAAEWKDYIALTSSPKPSIYISHCAAEDQFATGMLVAISMALNESGFDVLVDEKRTQWGNEGRRQIYRRLQQCHGAIILFSESALKSDWVEYETKLLTSRKFLEPDFIVLPVLLPSLKPVDCLQSYVSSVLINVSQQLTLEDTLDAVIYSTLERFAPLRNGYSDSPLQKLEGMIAPQLKGVDRDVLLRVAKELKINVEKWPQLADHCRTLLAQELLRADLSSVCKAMDILARHIKENDALDIVEILASSWVDERAAARIPEVVKRPLTERTIYVNSDKEFTGRMYVRRACNASPSWIILKVNNKSAEDPFGSLVKEIREEVKRNFCEDASNEFIDEWLKNPGEDIEPYIVLVPGYINDEVLIQLRQKYSGVTFFLLPGYEYPDVQKLKFMNIEFLLPELNSEQEKQAYGKYNHAYAIIHSSHRAKGGLSHAI